MGLLNRCFRNNIGVTSIGSAQSLVPGQHDEYDHWEKFCNQQGNTTVLKTAARPGGYYLMPECYDPPILVGEMSTSIFEDHTVEADLIGTINITVDIDQADVLEAIATLAVNGVCNMTQVDALVADIVGTANISVSINETHVLTASISAFADMVVALSQTDDLDAIISAYGNMSVDIVSTGDILNTANVGAAVWAALAASNNDPDTMGELLNLAVAAVYTAKIKLQDDDGSGVDRYVASWFKNGAPVDTVPTSPTIQVVKAADGSNLIGATSMTQIGSTVDLRYFESTAGNRIVSGAVYTAVLTAVIDGSVRSWRSPVGRDASA